MEEQKNSICTGSESEDDNRIVLDLEKFSNEWTDKMSQMFYEVGVCHGGSLKIWCEYFENAHVTGVEINESSINYDILKGLEGRYTIKIGDAYDREFVKTFENKKFDVIIDDGSHRCLDQVKFIKYYFDLLTFDGVLIIEDI